MNQTNSLEEIKVFISLLGIVLTASVGILTITTNIILTTRNYIYTKKQAIKEKHIDAINTYYTPVKFLLLEIQLAYMMIQTDGFCIFNDYKSKINPEKEKDNIINKYKHFIEVYKTLDKKFTNYEIDKKIEQVYKHILFISMGLDKKISLQRDEYVLPDIKHLIKNIDNYSEEYLGDIPKKRRIKWIL